VGSSSHLDRLLSLGEGEMDKTKSSSQSWKEEEQEVARAACRARSNPVFSAEVGEIGWDWRLRCQEEEDEVWDGLLVGLERSGEGGGSRSPQAKTRRSGIR